MFAVLQFNSPHAPQLDLRHALNRQEAHGSAEFSAKSGEHSLPLSEVPSPPPTCSACLSKAALIRHWWKGKRFDRPTVGWSLPSVPGSP
jgi:hypothetical protein